MLDINRSLLLLIDVQVKLFAAMNDKEALQAGIHTLVKGAGILGIPILVTEQYPSGLGSTIPEVDALVKEISARANPSNPPTNSIDKMTFSCWSDRRCRVEIEASGRNQILLAGIEAHVCVYQTALDLLAAGYEVHVVTEAVGSRTARNKDLGLQKMRDAGAEITGIEMALFELLRTAEAPAFREISRLVK